MAQNFPKAQVEKKETCEPNNKKTIAKVDWMDMIFDVFRNVEVFAILKSR
jgi:hypothetical protein